jgi:hypothetical protein
MKERAAATALRQEFARVSANSGWTSIADNDVARVAVRAFAQEARADGQGFREVIVEVFALIDTSTDAADESARETIAHWVVEVFYPLPPIRNDGETTS